MRPRAPALLLALLGSVVAAPALAFTPERAGLMVDAMRALDCSMNGEQAEASLAPLGLEGIEVQAFVDTLFGAGLVSLSEDMTVLSLVPMLCAAGPEESMAMIVEAFEAQESSIERWRPDFTPERGAELIATLRGLDCVLTEERAQEVLPPLGFTPVETRDIVAVLVDGTLAEVAEDGTALSLTESVCAADPSMDAPALQALLASWDERHPAPEIVIEQGADQ
mgnify:FL=1